MSSIVTAYTVPEKLQVQIEDKEILALIKSRFYDKFRKSLDIEVQEGWLMRYECTSYHNNDYEYVRLRGASEEEIEQYAFWCQIKELFEEK